MHRQPECSGIFGAVYQVYSGSVYSILTTCTRSDKLKAVYHLHWQHESNSSWNLAVVEECNSGIRFHGLFFVKKYEMVNEYVFRKRPLTHAPPYV